MYTASFSIWSLLFLPQLPIMSVPQMEFSYSALFHWMHVPKGKHHLHQLQEQEKAKPWGRNKTKKNKKVVSWSTMQLVVTWLIKVTLTLYSEHISKGKIKIKRMQYSYKLLFWNTFMNFQYTIYGHKISLKVIWVLGKQRIWDNIWSYFQNITSWYIIAASYTQPDTITCIETQKNKEPRI